MPKHAYNRNEHWQSMMRHASSPLLEDEEEFECEFESDKLESVSALLPPVPVSMPPFPCAASAVSTSVLLEDPACLSSLKNASIGRSNPIKDQRMW